MDTLLLIFIICVCCSVSLLFALCTSAYYNGKASTEVEPGITDLVQRLVSFRSVYVAALVHICDTLSDYIIVATWTSMAIEEQRGERNYENVNMLSFVIPSIIWVFVHRVVYARYHWKRFGNTEHQSLTDLALILLDLYVFVFVYQSFKGRYLSPTVLQRFMHQMRAIFESMMQLVLQSIFLFRSYDTDFAVNGPTYFIFISIALSLLSIVLKSLDEDHRWVHERAQSAHCTLQKCPCISPSYLAVVVWRCCESVSRFAIFALMWSAVGGAQLILYAVIDFGVFLILAKYTSLLMLMPNGKQWKQNKGGHSFLKILFVVQSVVGIPLRPKISLIVIRFLDNIFVLCLVAAFAFNANVRCFGCTNQSVSNPYIRWTLYMALFCSLLQPAIYGGLRWTELLADSRDTTMQTRFMGMGEFTSKGQAQAAMHPMMLEYAERKQAVNTAESPNGKARPLVAVVSTSASEIGKEF